MTPTEFCYWLQGLIEVGRPVSFDAEQIGMIREHLNLVFEKVTGKPGDVARIEADAKRVIDEISSPPPRPSRRDGKRCSSGTFDPNTKYC